MPPNSNSASVCDKWVWLKVAEFVLCVACVIAKRITDDETTRVHLILQRVSREWSLLRNVTWGRVGAALGDATYGGYTIITAGLLLARLTREMPQGHRITEFFFLGLGALLFVILASLELFGVDELPDHLIDNAIILGTLSMMTALLFLIDLAGPRKRSKKAASQTTAQPFPFPVQLKPVPPKPQDDIVKQRTLPQRETTFPATIEAELITDWEPYKPTNRILTPQTIREPIQTNGKIPNGIHSKRQTIQTQTSIPNGLNHVGTNTTDTLLRPTIKPPDPPAWMKAQRPRSPLQIETELHSPVWSRYRAKSPVSLSPIKKVTTSSFLLPMPTLDEHHHQDSSSTAQSSPIDPGFVQYAVDKWEEKRGNPKTPKHSPTQV